MKFYLAFLVIFLISPTGQASGGFSFLIQQNWTLKAADDCTVLIDQLDEVLFGPALENQDLAKYSMISCTPSGLPERELNLEILFESVLPQEQGRIVSWIKELEKAQFKGVDIKPKQVQKIFFSIYNFAYQLVSGFWQYIGGFEAPHSADDYQTVYMTKEKWKTALAEINPYPFLRLLNQSLSAKDWKVWYEQILPATDKFESKIYTYYILENNEVVKSQLYFQLERNCTFLKCK